MMQLDLYQIDSFTNDLFGGNPACVVPLHQWLPDEVLRNIAAENAVAETAFFIPDGNEFQLRWFTPEIEMDLCGHATLATAFVLNNFLGEKSGTMNFRTLSGGLSVTVANDIYTLDFPSRPPVKADLPRMISESLNIQPKEVWRSRDFVLVYESEAEIKSIVVEKNMLDRINLDPGGVIVTAKGDKCDFVSRYFTPQASIMEDPVTGSAHCSLIPFWSRRLDKPVLKAVQLSRRRGELFCQDKGERVLISGRARTYSAGKIFLQ
jgi:PhzF family phenazine biosynthesis protein